MLPASSWLLVTLLACRADPDPVGQPYDPGSAVIGPAPTLTGDPPTNVLLVGVDTLRKDHLSRYDPEGRDLTPFLDGLMREGFVADGHRTCSNWTFHGVSCSLVGSDPVELGLMPKLFDDLAEPWPASQRFLVDELGDAGFYSVMASANGWVSPEWGLDGYDAFYGTPFEGAESLYTSATADLEAALERGEADRWLLHLHLLEPHAPYDPPAEYLEALDGLDPVPWDLTVKTEHYEATLEDWVGLPEEQRALLEQHMRIRYEGEVRWLDDLLEGFWTDLQARGWLDDTLVVFYTDHGEQFWERDHQSHAWNLHVEENDGVMFLWAPGLEPAATVGPSTQSDLPPTVLDLLELPVPASMSGLPLGTARADRPRFAASHARSGVLQSVTYGERQLMYSWQGFARFYDLSSDPLQQADLFDPQLTEVQQLWEMLRPRIEAARPLAPEAEPTAPEGLEL